MPLIRALLRSLIVSAALALQPFSSAMAFGPDSVSELAAQLSPAVVNISSSRRVPFGRGMPFPSAPEGSQLRELFERLNPNSGEGEQAMREAKSLGSGFVISADGYIVTNNHVVAGAEEILIYLSDGTRLPATLVGADQKTDLAVLKVEAAQDLIFVEFGDSDTAEVGDWVMAIGNPFGLGGSVTLGIVSARNRDIESGPYDNFIQTDASINQGNSGGPLFDMDGNVVGINTAIIAMQGASLGIGFAVPGNLARSVIEQLAEFGETRRGYLGVGIQDITEDIALSLGRATTVGALVINVSPGGPSEGVLLEGDLILEFNAQPVLRMRDLPRIVAGTAVGSAVPVKVLRNGAEQVFDITLGRLEGGDAVTTTSVEVTSDISEGGSDVVASPATLSDLLGFGVTSLDAETRTELGLAPDVGGVAIGAVSPGSDAAEKGLRTGLIISEVNQRPIGTIADLDALVAEARQSGRPAVLFKIRDAGGSTRFVAIKLRAAS